jgi:uncharacterized damage-inducible protein DinB
MAPASESKLAKQFLTQAVHLLREVHLPRIESCLALLKGSEVWWRPNAASNSVGNLVLHLNGNLGQWIVAALGGAPDRRVRDQEFAERGPIPTRQLQARLHEMVLQACRVIEGLSQRDLRRPLTIQGFRVNGLEAIFHAVEHFSHHTGQIVLLTKQQKGRDLGFTSLPGGRKRRRGLPAV